MKVSESEPQAMLERYFHYGMQRAERALIPCVR